MPLPSNEQLLALGEELLGQLDAMSSKLPGFRPAHAKGIFLGGRFEASPEAIFLTRAPHATRTSTPVTVRFSNSTGVPEIADTEPTANPRGMAIRFHLAERDHTDIISHATDGFPTRTGQEFLEFLKAAAASASSKESPTPMEAFLATHPGARAFVGTPKPTPSSFAREAYFGVTAYRFTNKDGVSKFGRYRIRPHAGEEYLDAAALQGRSANFLLEEITSRVAAGPVRFQVTVQVADEQDVVDDATIHWPEGRQVIQLGQIVLTDVLPAEERRQQRIIFDPIPRVDGIEPSGDPLLELRAAIYLMSGRRRRQATGSE